MQSLKKIHAWAQMQVPFYKKRNPFKYLRKTNRVPNSFGPDPSRQSVGPDLGPNFLQMLSEDCSSRGN